MTLLGASDLIFTSITTPLDSQAHGAWMNILK